MGKKFFLFVKRAILILGLMIGGTAVTACPNAGAAGYGDISQIHCHGMAGHPCCPHKPGSCCKSQIPAVLSKSAVTLFHPTLFHIVPQGVAYPSLCSNGCPFSGTVFRRSFHPVSYLILRN